MRTPLDTIPLPPIGFALASESPNEILVASASGSTNNYNVRWGISHNPPLGRGETYYISSVFGIFTSAPPESGAVTLPHICDLGNSDFVFLLLVPPDTHVEPYIFRS